MSNLLKENIEFKWLDEQENSFQKIKEKLVSNPILKLYNPRAHRTELHTDASATGLGAILLQSDKEKDPLQMVYAISRCTSEAESKYHSSRLELLVIAWALQRLRPFLIRIEFVVVTDCQSLVHMNAWKTKNSQISRWMSELSEFNVQIKHRSGKSITHVDALSRAPVEKGYL